MRKGNALAEKIVDIYLPLDSRDEPNAEVWPVAEKQLNELVRVIRDLGWEPMVTFPELVRMMVDADIERLRS